MSDIIVRAQKSWSIVGDHLLAPGERVWKALEALSGLILSDLNGDARARIEAELVGINQISDRYVIESEADYDRLTDADAAEILSRIGTVTQLCIGSEAERVMLELDTSGRKLPEAAIEEVREHPDVFVPLLIQSLEQAIAKIRNGETHQGDASFFAVFLLTELKVDEAFSAILNVLRLPGEGPFELLGDVIHELVPSILTQFSQGDLDLIGEIVRDTSVNSYVRWSAAGVYKYLVRDELISRPVAVEALHRHFQDCMESKDCELLAALACELGDLAADQALETIRSAYERQLVDEGIVDFEFIESQIAGGEATVQEELKHCRPTGIPDTIAELRSWATFQEKPSRPQKIPKLRPTSAHTSGQPLAEIERAQPMTIRVDAKVGRNAPCPCGSGKKFKKCCHRS